MSGDNETIRETGNDNQLLCQIQAFYWMLAVRYSSAYLGFHNETAFVHSLIGEDVIRRKSSLATVPIIAPRDHNTSGACLAQNDESSWDVYSTISIWVVAL